MEKDDANFELFSKILKGVFKFDLKKVNKKEFDEFLSKYDHGLTLKSRLNMKQHMRIMVK